MGGRLTVEREDDDAIVVTTPPEHIKETQDALQAVLPLRSSMLTRGGRIVLRGGINPDAVRATVAKLERRLGL